MAHIEILDLDFNSELFLNHNTISELTDEEQKKVQGGFITGGDIGGGIAAGVATAAGASLGIVVAVGLAGIVVGNVVAKMIETGCSGTPVANISDIIAA